MMAASRGYRPTPFQAALCLQITWELASVQWRDPIGPQELVPPGSDSAPLPWQSAHALQPLVRRVGCAPVPMTATHARAPMQEASCVRSIIARARFGGMRGDVAMLHACARVWHARFAADACPAGEHEVQPQADLRSAASVPAMDLDAMPAALCAAPGTAGERGAAASAFQTARQLAVGGRSLPYVAWERMPCSASGGDGATAGPALLLPQSWLGILVRIYSACSVPRAAIAAAVARGPLQPADIVPAALDFHCSNILGAVLGRADIANAAAASLDEAGAAEVESAAKLAMWLFRSSVTGKRRIRQDAAYRADDEEEARSRLRLADLWQILAQPCERWCRWLLHARMSASSAGSASRGRRIEATQDE